MAGLEGLLTGHTLVKRYEIEEVIGRGGFAVVYRAVDSRLGRPVAVKVITLTAVDPGQREVLRERLHREARAAASLPHHPNLVTVHDVGTDPDLGLDFLVMELLRGENVAQYLERQGTPPIKQGLRILCDAAQGLAVGHRAGLIHRDVKPANIFLAESHEGDDEAFRVCLLDYGIVQIIEDDQTVTRGLTTNPLSPAYASPEQVRGDRDLTPAADVFSLGVAGYQILTGERPFSREPGQAPTDWNLRRPIRQLNPDVPAAVEQVVTRAMSFNPAERYPDAGAFSDALTLAMRPDDETAIAPAPAVISVAPPPPEEERTAIAPAPPVRRTRPVPAAVSLPPGEPRSVPADGGPARKRSGTWIAVLLVALLAGAGVMWAAIGGGGGGGDEEPEPKPMRTADTTAAGAPADEGEAVIVEPGDNAPAGESPAPVGGADGGTDDGGTSAPADGGQPMPQPSPPSGGQQPVQGPPAITYPQQPQPQQPVLRPAPQPRRPAPQQPQRPPQRQPQRPPVQQRPPAQQPQPPVQQPPVYPQPQPQPQPPIFIPPPRPAPRDTIFIPPGPDMPGLPSTAPRAD